MGFTVNKNTSVAVMVEDSEGTYKAPESASDFVQTLADGFEMSQTKEVIERNIFTSSVGRTSPRTGQFQSSGTIPAELRANSTQGAAPEFDKLIHSALGTKRQITSEVVTRIDGEDANTATVLLIDDLDINKFTVGDIVMVKEAGAFHVSPITIVDDTPGDCKITLLVAKPSGVFSPGVTIAKSTVYTVADAGHPSLSVSKWLENKVLEYAVGAKCTTMSIENFTTGQIPSISFGFEGLNFDRSLTVNNITPSYNNQLPPIMLDGRVFLDGTDLCVNEVTVSLENTLGFVTCISAPNGRMSSRVTERTITGSFNPYKQDDNIDNFNRYKANTPFSLFAYGKVPSSTPGEFTGVVAIYMPNCLITELGESDQDGILQDAITFSADRGVSGNIPEIYVAFI
jgi:hypothetical protein